MHQAHSLVLVAVAILALIAGCSTRPGGGGVTVPQDSEALQDRAGDGDKPTANLADEPESDCCAYFEQFATASISDCESSTCKVKWCDGAETTSNQCGAEEGRALKVLAGADHTTGPVVWVWWGDLEAKEVRIEFTYGQHQGTVPQPHLASSRLAYKRSSQDTFDERSCPSVGFAPLADMPKTHTIPFDCFPVTEVVPVEEGQRAIYFRFSKLASVRNTPLLRVNDLRITVVPADPPPQ